MLRRREQRAYGTATQVVRADIPKERGQHGVDNLNDAIPVEYTYTLQGAGDKVIVVLCVFLLRLLHAPRLNGFTRQGTMRTSSLRGLGMGQGRDGSVAG